MHQLQLLIGEQAVNAALKSLLTHHSYPQSPPSSLDFLNELYNVSPQHLHARIDEYFKAIITYDLKMNSVSCIRLPDNTYRVSFKGRVHKYQEDGFGRRKELQPDKTIEVSLYTKDGNSTTEIFPGAKNIAEGKFIVGARPAHIVMDPLLKHIDRFVEDNSRNIEVNERIAPPIKN